MNPFDLTRDEIIDYLETHLCIACYDEESTDELRDVLVDNTNDPCIDGLLCEHKNHAEFRGRYFYQKQELSPPKDWHTFLGEFPVGSSEPQRLLEPGWTLIEVESLEPDSKFFFQTP